MTSSDKTLMEIKQELDEAMANLSSASISDVKALYAEFEAGFTKTLANVASGNYTDRRYTGKDIASIRQNLINSVSTLTDKWTDFNESDIGMVYLELLAGTADMLNFYMDKQTAETYLETATQPKNIRSLIRGMNYRIPLKGSNHCSVQLNLLKDTSEGFWIPRYTELKGGKHPYVIAEDVFIDGKAGMTWGEAIQGTVQILTPTAGELKKSRRFSLGKDNVCDKSVIVLQDNAVWEECDDALLKYMGGYFYSIHVDSDNKAYILWSPDWKELLPSDDDEVITIKCLLTDGLSAKVEAGELNGIDAVLVNGIDVTKNIEVANENPSSGGWDDIPLEVMKPIAQSSMSLMDRYVTLGDYETAIRQEPYIGSCFVADWKTPELVDRPYLVKIWAVYSDGQELNEVDKANLTKKLLEKGVSSIEVRFEPVDYIELELNISLLIRGRKAARDTVRKLVEEMIREKYTGKQQEFGKRLSLSRLLSDVYACSDLITNVTSHSPSSDIEVPVTGIIKYKKAIITVDEDDVL